MSIATIPGNAQVLLGEATRLQRLNQYAKAGRLLLKAIAILESDRPDSEELADAYRSMCWVHAFGRYRKADRAQHRHEAATWYEKAIAVWERNGNKEALAGNLSNLGSLYYRFGDYKTSLERNLRGLELEKERSELDDESIAVWNHVAGCYLALARLDEAEAVVQDGFARFGDATPNSAYLWGTLARIHEARAAQCMERARELAPPQSCAIG